MQGYNFHKNSYYSLKLKSKLNCLDNQAYLISCD